MAYTNDAPINPNARRRFDPTPGVYGQALPLQFATPSPGKNLQPPSTDGVSLAAAQAAARTWADKALDLDQAGDAEQCRYAIFRAEAWLVKVLALEVQDARHGNDKLPIARRRAQPRLRPGERREAEVSNATLRAWQRSHLCEQDDKYC